MASSSTFRPKKSADVSVLDVQPKDRHLLLMVRQPAERPGLPDIKDKFLCGHDERHWFVAGVPEAAPVSNVVTAKEALRPVFVRNLESGKKGKLKQRQRRRTKFHPSGRVVLHSDCGMTANEKLVLHNEPLRRGGGKPHVCEFLYRVGGTTVAVCGQYPNGALSNSNCNTVCWRGLRRVFDSRGFFGGVC